VQEAARSRRVVRFENLRSGELRRAGSNIVRFPEQPFRILTMLLDRPGDVVSRPLRNHSDGPRVLDRIA
jgi:DNA-binding winged helix-turn-helix (wHTH) protein